MEKMKGHLYVSTMAVIVVTALVFILASESFGFLGEDRDFRNISIVSPLGGEKFVAGSKQKISWQSSRSIRYVKIQYSIDNGKKWIEIVKNMEMDTAVASYDWQVPCTPTTKAKIRISDVYGLDFDVTINTFSILCDDGSRKEN
jgi:hypothetical protein